MILTLQVEIEYNRTFTWYRPINISITSTDRPL